MAVSGRSCLKNVNFEPILLCLAGMVVGLLGLLGLVELVGLVDVVGQLNLCSL